MLKKVRIFFKLIKFEHTVFALPFAYMGMVLAERRLPALPVLIWTTLAMIGARTAGMTLNRIIDIEIDRRNPRTQSRPSVTGEFRISWSWIAVAVSLVIFFLSSWFLNPLCFKLSFAALIFLVGYHYVKRFSFLCHFTLGIVLAIAPVGGWFAVTGIFSWKPLLLAAAVLFWTAGFDILYSLQDVDFDRANGLHSVPVKFGKDEALVISRGCHVATVVFLALFGWAVGLGLVYWAGIAVCAVLLWVEHNLIRDGDLTNINAAFFMVNGWVGVLLFIFTFMEIFR